MISIRFNFNFLAFLFSRPLSIYIYIDATRIEIDYASILFDNNILIHTNVYAQIGCIGKIINRDDDTRLC